MPARKKNDDEADSSTESVPSLPTESSPSHSSGSSYNPTKKSKVRKAADKVKNKIKNAFKAKPKTKSTPATTKATQKVAAARVPRMSDEAFKIEVEKIQKAKPTTNARHPGQIISHPPRKQMVKEARGKNKDAGTESQSGESLQGTVKPSRKQKIHPGCTIAAKKLMDYLTAKIELKNTPCEDDALLPKVGEIVKSATHDYKVVALIAKTCFGGVYKVEDTVTKNVFAMKATLKAGNEELRLYCSALLKLKSIKSENCVKLFDHGRSKYFNFIVITFAKMDVAQLIREHGELSVGTAVALSKQSLMAIGDLHKVGLLHRDVKEKNILIAIPGDYHCVMLSGFGLSGKFDTEGGALLTFSESTKPTANSSEEQPAVVPLPAPPPTIPAPIPAPPAPTQESAFIIGSLKTGSLAGLKARKLYRKHDFESWFYTVCGWFGATLPWDDNDNICDVVRLKESLIGNIGDTRKELMKQLPIEVNTIFNYIFTLEKDEKADIEWICKILDLILRVERVPAGYKVDWDRSAAYRSPPTSKKYCPPPKELGAYYLRADIHFNLIFHGQVHHWNQVHPAQERSNRPHEKVTEFTCAVKKCQRRIQVVEYDEAMLKDGDKAVGVHVISAHTCKKYGK